MADIERRAGRNIFLFTLGHGERYSCLARYRSRRAEFRTLVRGLLPDGWALGEGEGIWCMARPPVERMPDAGFKIHLSATNKTASALISAVVPILVTEGVSFKFLVDEAMLDFNNSSCRDSGSCGKFITIYPADINRFRWLIEHIHEATANFDGPYILSDKRYEGNKVLFYRYGAFRGRAHVNVYGEMEMFLVAPDGQIIRDVRFPYFSLPSGVADPYPAVEHEVVEPVLKGRYKATRMMSSSSKGGVYRCIDLETGVEVVVKEARPFVNRGQQTPYDAIDCLKNEHEILKLLESTGVTPRVLDLFQDWENEFLIMELAGGVPLSAYRASEGFSILFMTRIDKADLQRYCTEFIGIARRLLDGTRAIHARGVVIQDLAPQNLLFDPESLKVTFVDFEAAYADREGGRGPIIQVHTPGFGEEKRGRDERATTDDDYRALGSVFGDLLYPVTPFFTIAPQSRGPLLKHFAKEKGIPKALVRLILGVGDQPERIDALLSEAEQSLKDITAPAPLSPLRQDADLRRIINEIVSYLRSQTCCGDDPLDLPTDYRRYTTNGLNVAYGAAGIASFLRRVTGEAPEAMLDALLVEASRIDNDHYAPGLYVGTSGIAWTLLDLGLRREAEALMNVAARSPLLFESADMFYGAAGFGLANLFFFEQLGGEEYLAHAIDAFHSIRSKLQRVDAGYFYESAGDVYHGLAHGASGIGYFMLRLYQATGQEEHLEYGRGLLNFDLASAEERGETLVFRRSAREPVLAPYWRSGSAGIGCVALRFHAVLNDARYLHMARKVAQCLEGKYSVSPANLSGMAGIGHFFLDMHLATREGSYLDEARRFVDRIMLFAVERPAGIVFPGEGLLRVSTDHATGSAGIGAFLQRILTCTGIPFFDFDPHRGA